MIDSGCDPATERRLGGGLYSDTLYGDRRFRMSNVLDEDVREGLAIEMDMSLSVERVIWVLEQVVSWRGQP